MVLNITTDYAVRILVYLAAVRRQAPAQELSEKMNIPGKYITSIAKKLKASGLISSTQGSGGGYCLERDPASINLADVIWVMENGIRLNRCDSCGRNCFIYGQHSTCPISNAYGAVKAVIESAFARITIQDLAENSVCKGGLDYDDP